MKITISDVRRTNKEAGGYFFSRKSMKFFNSRIESGVLTGGGELSGRLFFITSEQYGETALRHYKVREIINGGEDITTPFDGPEFHTKERAKDFLSNQG